MAKKNIFICFLNQKYNKITIKVEKNNSVLEWPHNLARLDDWLAKNFFTEKKSNYWSTNLIFKTFLEHFSCSTKSFHFNYESTVWLGCLFYMIESFVDLTKAFPGTSWCSISRMNDLEKLCSDCTKTHRRESFGAPEAPGQSTPSISLTYLQPLVAHIEAI